MSQFDGFDYLVELTDFTRDLLNDWDSGLLTTLNPDYYYEDLDVMHQDLTREGAILLDKLYEVRQSLEIIDPKRDIGQTPTEKFQELKTLIESDFLERISQFITLADKGKQFDRTQIDRLEGIREELLKDLVEQFPHVAKRRMQWGGKPTVQSVEPIDRRTLGYVMRSMSYALPKVELIPLKQQRSRFLRSVSHQAIHVDITPIEPKQYVYEDMLYELYLDLGERLLREHHTSEAMREAWDEYISVGALHDFLRDRFRPDANAFRDLEHEIKDFLEDEWQHYNVQARKAREQRFSFEERIKRGDIPDRNDDIVHLDEGDVFPSL